MRITTPVTRRTVAYLRVSTDEQANEGYSLADQERQCRAYAIAREWPEVAEVYVDPGVSGATRDRPALKRLLTDAKSGTIERIICTKLDRMGRRAADILAIEDELDVYSVERVYIKDSIDTSTPTGRLLRTVLAAVAELERDMILERTRAGKDEKILRGEVWRGIAPYGYRYIRVDKRTGTPGRLEIDPDASPIITRIFGSIARGTSTMALAKELTSEGVLTPNGLQTWGFSTILKIVHNPVYAGRATYGRMRTVRTPTGKKLRQRRTEADTKYVNVDPIVSTDLLNAAQQQLSRNHQLSDRNTKHEYLLGGGLLRCAICGFTMSGSRSNGGKTVRYRCAHARADGSREMHSVSGAQVEAAVWDALHGMLRDPSRVLDDVQALADSSSTQARELEATIKRITCQSDSVAAENDRLLDLYLKGKIDEDRYTAKSVELTARRQELRDSISELMGKRDGALAQVLPVDDVKAICAYLARGLDKLTFDERRGIVRTLCTRIVTTRERVDIEGWLPAMPTTVPLMQDQYIVSTSSRRRLAPRPRPHRRRR